MEQKSIASRLHAAFQFFVRFLIASILMFYATPKMLGVQFQLANYNYDMPLGEFDGYSLAWAFFAHSFYYQFMIGLAEITIGFLLLFRRTKLLGICCALPVIINILMVDYFFGVNNALPVAVTLFVGVVYLLALELPRLKSFFWDQQTGSLTNPKAIGSLAYGMVVLFAGLGLDTYLSGTLKSPQDGSYKIERYTVNGAARELSAGKFGKDPMMYFEFGSNTVQSFDGQEIFGRYTFDAAKQEFSITPNRKNPDVIFSGTYQTNGDETILRGKQGADDVELLLKRIIREKP